MSFSTTQVNLEDVMFREINQAQKDKYNISHVESKKVELLEVQSRMMVSVAGECMRKRVVGLRVQSFQLDRRKWCW